MRFLCGLLTLGEATAQSPELPPESQLISPPLLSPLHVSPEDASPEQSSPP